MGHGAPSTLRLLFVDGHSGPLSDAIFYLRRYMPGVRIDFVTFYVYSRWLTTRRDALLPVEGAPPAEGIRRLQRYRRLSI